MILPDNSKYQIAAAYLIALIVGLCFIALNYPFSFYALSDGPFHLAAIRTFSFDAYTVSPILKLPGISDHHYNISILFQKALYLLTGDMRTTILLSGAVFIVAFLWSFILLASRYCRDPREIVLTLISLLFLSGPISIIWAGAYSFSGLMMNGFYPQTFAYALFCIGMYFASSGEQNHKTKAALLLLVFATLVQHILTGIVFLFSYYLLLVYRYISQKHYDLTMILLPIPGALLYLAWPYYPTTIFIADIWPSLWTLLPWIIFGFGFFFLAIRFFKLITPILIELIISAKNKRIESFSNKLYSSLVFFFAIVMIALAYFYRSSVPALSPAHFKTWSPLISLCLLALVPVLIYILFERERDFISIWAPVLLLLTVAAWLLDVSGYWRLLFFTLIVAMIPVGRQIARIQSRKLKLAILSLALAMFLAQIDFLNAAICFDRYQELYEVGKIIPPDAIVLSDADSSYRLTGLTGANVLTSFTAHWSNFTPHDVKMQRKKDIEDFFSISSSSEKRKAILARYRPSHILVKITSYDIEGYHYEYAPLIMKELQSIGEIIYQSDNYFLLKLTQHNQPRD